jgi:hypothetical protein
MLFPSEYLWMESTWKMGYPGPTTAAMDGFSLCNAYFYSAYYNNI